VRRALTNNCDVIVRGQRYPLVGTVSMDNITIDLGPEPVVRTGDEAILIGVDGGARQTAEQLARRIGTINYEIVCGISSRVPRAYHHDGDPVQ
jgi:alanine racemase